MSERQPRLSRIRRLIALAPAVVTAAILSVTFATSAASPTEPDAGIRCCCCADCARKLAALSDRVEALERRVNLMGLLRPYGRPIRPRDPRLWESDDFDIQPLDAELEDLPRRMDRHRIRPIIPESRENDANSLPADADTP